MPLSRVREALQPMLQDGYLPGYVAGVRRGGQVDYLAAGFATIGDEPAQARPMSVETLFRIASLSKPVAGALTLALVEQGALELDDPVQRWLPEFADRRVLRHSAAELDDTVPADRPITVRDLLTFTAGLGWVDGPLGRAMVEAGLQAGPKAPPVRPDEYVEILGGLPSAAQPGERFQYHTATEVLGVLLMRLTRRPLIELLDTLINRPLGLSTLAFEAHDVTELATSYEAEDGRFTVYDEPAGDWSAPPVFESLATGLVSSVPDYLRFLCALADGDLISRDGVAAMSSDQLTPAQRETTDVLAPGCSWGFQVEVGVEPFGPWPVPGWWGWMGGLGTSAYVDPSRDLVGVLFTQRMFSSADTPPEHLAFWTALGQPD